MTPPTQAIAHLDRLIQTALRVLGDAAGPAELPRSDTPWEMMRVRLGLTATEELSLALVVAIELDDRARRLMRQRSQDASRIWPDVGLLAGCVYRAPEQRVRMVEELGPDGILSAYRLLESVGSARQVEDAPFAARPLRVSRRVLELVHGVARLDPEVAAWAVIGAPGPTLDALIVSDEAKQQTGDLMAGAAEGGPILAIGGHDGAGRYALLAALAHARGRPTLRIRCSELPVDERELARAGQAVFREARLFDALPVLDGIDDLTGDDDAARRRLRALDRAVLATYPGVVGATTLPSERRRARPERGMVVVELPVPEEAARATAWRASLGAEAPAELVTRVAARYHLTVGSIRRAATPALELARARREPLNGDDVHAGVRSILDGKLTTLGTRVTWQQRWADLVLPEDILDEIHEFIGRVRHRKRVLEEWGFARKVARGLGLSALFSGPPGTGKTMVSGIIADQLGLDLYQIDLARIVSKYVGETEKNLAQVFDAAEAGHAILLFDEADSLFAKRTDVKSSVDRYANLEVNYLLQRMEAFRGITILTTNNDAAIDDAFGRRLSLRIDFPIPDTEERERLWRTMIPDEAARAPDLDDRAFAVLAEKYMMSGGYIRNAAMRAAFLAAEQGGAISLRHLQRAAALEYAAMGKVMSWS